MRTRIKYLLIALAILYVIFSIGWFVGTYRTAKQVNEVYAKQNIPLPGIEAFIRFTKITPTGYPNKIAWRIDNAEEEYRNFKVIYHEPLTLGYDILAQQLFIEYQGEVTKIYKPEKDNKGIKTKFDHVRLSITTPISYGLFVTLNNYQDPIRLINHMLDFRYVSGPAEIIDLQTQEKLMQEDHEHFLLTYRPRQFYFTQEEFFENLPSQYDISYKYKNRVLDQENKFVFLPTRWSKLIPLLEPESKFANQDLALDIRVDLNKRSDREIFDDFKIQIRTDLNDDFAKIENANFLLHYIHAPEPEGAKPNLKIGYKCKNSYIKFGTFEYLFNEIPFENLLQSSKFYGLYQSDIKLIIKNLPKVKVALQQLEEHNQYYKIAAKLYNLNDKIKFEVDKFTFLIDDFGYKLQTQGDIDKYSLATNIEGVLLLKNFEKLTSFIDNINLKITDEEFSPQAWNLYLKTNNRTLRSISDHPHAESPDITISYKEQFDNKDDFYTKIALKGDLLWKHYHLALYQELFNEVGYSGDILANMQAVLPYLDTQEPMLQDILASLNKSKSPKTSEKTRAK